MYDLTGSGFVSSTPSGYVVDLNTLDPSSGFTSNFALDYSLPGGGPLFDVSTFPSNISYGTLTLDCLSCTSPGVVYSAIFPAFTVDITVTDTTNSATGTFVGASSGGAVSYCVSNCPGDLNTAQSVGSSNISISWSPSTLSGAGTTGNFGPNSFNIDSPTGVVDPTTNAGVSTIQGSIDQASAVPEPATLAIAGAALLSLGLIGRTKRS